MIVFCGVLMVVLRAGASRVFFDVVGTFQAQNMMDDVEATVTTMNAIVIDGLSGMEEAGAMVAEQMQKIVAATVPLSQELEMATLEFKKFVSVAEGDRLAKEVRNVGLQFGFTSQESLEAGARMAQLSSMIGEDAVPAATEMALAFGLIGDMTPETAMLKLINLQQQTQFVYGDSTKAAYDLLTAEQQIDQVRKEMANTLNTLNKVEDNSAATMSKITGVMNEFASQAHLAGEEISMMAAMSAVLIEAGEEQGKGGRALRMIYARLGADTSGAASFLEKLGVRTKEADGSLRALSDILEDLNPMWSQMTSGQKQTTAQMVAGNRHYVRFLKLAENYDRIQQLNAATMGDMGAVYDESGEAVGFLNDMMSSNAIALDAANAKLELVNSQIGDFFIPTTVAATEFQALFNEQLLIMLEDSGRLGQLLGGFFEFQQIMSSVFAPFFSAIINVKAMNMALMTQRQISRALMGEELKRKDLNKQKRTEEAVSVEKLQARYEELEGKKKEELQTERAAATEAVENHEKKIANMNEQIIKLHELANTIDEVGFAETKLANIQRQKDAYNKAADELEKFTSERNITIKDNEIQTEIKNANTKAAVQRRVEALRFAQEELNLAIQDEIMLTERSVNKLTRKKTELAMTEVLIDKNTHALVPYKSALQGTSMAMEAQTQSIMKLSMVTMKLGMAFFVAEMVVIALKDAIPGVKDEAQAARIAMILMAMGMAIMTAEMIATTSSTFLATAATKNLTFAQRMQAWYSSITSVKLSIQTAKTIGLTIAKVALSAVMSIVFVAAALAVAVAIDTYLLPKLMDMTDVTNEASDSMGATADDAEAFADSMNASMSSLDFSAFDEGANAMSGFNSAREELFFGFKAGQVTGDLVKQVKQGGVENFVANTEIIMTNNFNGMTTDEAADEILRLIVDRGGQIGANITV